MSQAHSDVIWHRIHQKIKPVGALAQLESLAHQLALIQSQSKDAAVANIEIHSPIAIVFAGDHGIAAEGISIAPSDVTWQMVQNFLAGGARISYLCRINRIQLKVVDAGIISPTQHNSDDHSKD